MVSSNALNRSIGIKSTGVCGVRGVTKTTSGKFQVRIAGKSYGSYLTINLAKAKVEEILACLT